MSASTLHRPNPAEPEPKWSEPSDRFPGDAVNPFRAALPAALEGPANAIHGIGARRTAKVHWTFGSGSPLEA